MDVLLPLVAAVSGVIGAVVLAGFLGAQSNRNFARVEAARHVEKEAEVQRLDAVAAQAAEAAVLLAEETAKRAVAEESTGLKLDQIHSLVNSNLTAAMANELAAHKALLVRMESDGNDVAGEGLVSKTAEIVRIAELETQLASRAVAGEQADALGEPVA